MFRRRRFFQGRPVRGTNLEDIAWLTPDGQPMTDQQWTSGQANALTVFLNGAGIPEVDRHGRRIEDDSFLLLVNPSDQDLSFTLPTAPYGRRWVTCVDTCQPRAAGDAAEDALAVQHAGGGVVVLQSHSLQLLRRSA